VSPLCPFRLIQKSLQIRILISHPPQPFLCCDLFYISGVNNHSTLRHDWGKRYMLVEEVLKLQTITYRKDIYLVKCLIATVVCALATFVQKTPKMFVWNIRHNITRVTVVGAYLLCWFAIFHIWLLTSQLKFNITLLYFLIAVQEIQCWHSISGIALPDKPNNK
jgi:hypothetical protein